MLLLEAPLDRRQYFNPIDAYHLFAVAPSICRCFVSYCVFTSVLNGPITRVTPQPRGPALSEDRLIGLLTTVGY